MAYALFKHFLRFDPKDSQWPGRDRFVLSAGHGSMLLYSMLHLTGYDMSLEDLRSFRKFGSKTPGHPELHMADGVEVSTGPLGQGFGNGVGMAIAQAYLAARYNRPGYALFDGFIYALVSDGDLMEGIAAEAASMAGHLKLGRLVYLYDDNHISLDGPTSLAFTEDVCARFDAYGWHTQKVADGNDLAAIAAAIRAAQQDERPSLIAVRTVIGFGSPKAGTSKVHGSPLGADGVRETKIALGLDPEQSFVVPEEVGELMESFGKRGTALHAEWHASFEVYAHAYPAEYAELQLALKQEFPAGWDVGLPNFAPGTDVATRDAAGKALETLIARIPWLVGGSADLSESTKTPGGHDHVFQAGNPRGHVLWYGVREHAMGAAMNGMAAYGLVRAYGGTFLTFSDYMRGSIRLAALSQHAVVYVFTHDSIGVGEDGPTHQPVEHLAALRTIPNLTVIRPGDANEAVVAWQVALERLDGPTALILSRQKLPVFDRSTGGPAAGLRHGAYVLRDAEDPQVVLVASGSEVGIIASAQEQLAAAGIRARVVSFPSWELFDRQDASYRAQVLPPGLPVVAIEAGVSQGWHKYIGARGAVISVEKFGASAPYQEVYQAYGITPEAVVEQARRLVGP
jgi:transketolase